MRKILTFLFLTALLVTACAPSTPSPDSPVSDETPGADTPADYLPQPGDVALKRGEAFLDSFDLLTMESFPLQFSLVLAGSLPTPCHKLRVQVAQPDASKVIAVEVYSVVDPKEMCTQVLQPFQVSVPLGSFPAGHYVLKVNGKQVAEFDA